MRRHTPGRSRLLAAVLIGLAALIGGCTGSSGQGSAATVGTGIDYTGADGTIRVVDTSHREQPVALSGTTLEGTPLDLASMRGSVVVLNVWGSWCAPCHKEAPDLQRASTDLAARGVKFLGIASEYTNDPAAALAFQRTYKITYPSLMDDTRRAVLALRGSVAPGAVPSTLVIDPQGRIAGRISGGLTYATLTAVVTSVLDDKPIVIAPGTAATPTVSDPPSGSPAALPSATPSATPLLSGTP